MLRRFGVWSAVFLFSMIAYNQSMATPVPMARAIFAGGCFWCMQPVFDALDGVKATAVGYIGGEAQDANYHQVGRGITGHREAIEITYDPAELDYADILEIYWLSIDPFDAGGQFYDRGEQYRTAIYPTTDDQRAIAEASKAELQERFAPRIIATEILPATPFYGAETYHQDYYLKSADSYQAYKKASGRIQKLEDIWGTEAQLH